MANIVAVTSCPTGIAHTIMAAEGLEQAAKQLGHAIQVETQGSVGTRNTLTDEAIAAADVVIIAADTRVDTVRFLGKAIYESATEPAIRNGKSVIEAALASTGATSTSPAAKSLKIVGITSCPTGI
ncbi:MAG TPA: PTS fructose transporter subunit EIIBC, partial [Candidatus Competibacteraceae bacterium]|nr:PTS fructose transporter subunit EIIBC [Candidatus Competibacteraceae bacterium]